uniref:EF-hand domain-containing protein n=1 Tax=Strongyloides venezuelensis TaxID=75913 RepID=A0A0K0FPH5_STRVS
MDALFGRKNKINQGAGEADKSRNDTFSEDRCRSLSTESDSVLVDDHHIHDISRKRESISKILLGPETGLFGTIDPETNQHKKVSLDDFMTHYKKYQINGDGFEKVDYQKKMTSLVGRDM